MQYVFAQRQGKNFDPVPHSVPDQNIPVPPITKLTEIYAENLYFCLENRTVYVCEKEILLTAKEFDIFALLINLRHKLRVTPETPDYIRSIHSIGYKFNPNIELH